jgi:prepilin-type processing-associated H-X9-DG protein
MCHGANVLMYDGSTRFDVLSHDLVQGAWSRF